ncbi:MAG: hypothetical protein MJZ90_03195 [Bacteroidales bacterium]|nr:hypothetical protein [archaeon]MCQ2317913.1 hypothetical protein [Bacteroidales bacterium]
MKGICTNWDCPNFDENKKKIIEIPDGEEFVCPKCGKRLVEYTGESWFKKHKIAVIAASVVVVAIVIILCLTLPKKAGEEPKGGNNSETPSENTIVNEDPAQTGENNDTNQQEENSIDTIKEKPRDTIRIIEEPPVIITNVIEYSFGKYVGDAKKDIPEGSGTMYYYRHMQIAKHDKKNPPHYAEEGDYFIGTWGNGDIVNGALYSKDNVLKGKIFAPKRPNPYDLSKE